jgi:hypothetical protein
MVVVENGSFNWNKKLANVEIPKSRLVENKTLHVYLFEGQTTRETSENNYAFPLYAEVDKEHVVVVYFDSTNKYEENLGFYTWDWEVNASDFNSPLKNLVRVGRAEDGTFVYGAIHTKPTAKDGFGGLILYYGEGDSSKKTGNIEVSDATNKTYIANPKPAGEINFVYVVNAGDGNISNDNVYLDKSLFSKAAFAFTLVPFAPDQMTGTYAVNPTTIIVKTSKNVNNPDADAVTSQEQLAAENIIKSWFVIKNSNDVVLEIERVDFAKNNSTLNSFVITLKDTSALDNTKEYTVHFDLGYGRTGLTAKNVEVTINLTVPASTPLDANLSVGGSFQVQEWTPTDTNYFATRINATTFKLTFNVSVTNSFNSFEYKWTQGSWAVV